MLPQFCVPSKNNTVAHRQIRDFLVTGQNLGRRCAQGLCAHTHGANTPQIFIGYNVWTHPTASSQYFQDKEVDDSYSCHLIACDQVCAIV